MILLSLHCNACDAGWVQAVSRLANADSTCIFCGAPDIVVRDHDHPHAALTAVATIGERQAA